jgi:iron complex transport system substrate-binding protein
MKKINSIILMLILVGTFLSACAQPAQGPITITDGLGREVQLKGAAQRIVSLAASNTEILFAIGAGSQVIARDDLSDFPEEVVNLPAVGGYQGYDLEKITSLQPDLVLAAEINSPELVQSIENLGITVFYLSNPADINGLYDNLRIVGQLTGHESDAADLVQSLQQRVDAVQSALANATTTPKVFYEIDATDPSKPWTAGPGTYHDQFIRMAHAENVAANAASMYPQISQEELIVQNPDYILLADSIYGITPESVVERPGWAEIKAVQEGNLFPFDSDLLDRPGPRLVDGLETLAHILHPEVFAK